MDRTAVRGRGVDVLVDRGDPDGGESTRNQRQQEHPHSVQSIEVSSVSPHILDVIQLVNHTPPIPSAPCRSLGITVGDQPIGQSLFRGRLGESIGDDLVDGTTTPLVLGRCLDAGGSQEGEEGDEGFEVFHLVGSEQPERKADSADCDQWNDFTRSSRDMTDFAW